MHPLICEKQAEIAHLSRKFGIRRLEVFGSAARGDDFDLGRSDVDLIVEFSTAAARDPLGTYFHLRDCLSQVLGCSVDLVESGSITNPYVLRAIEQDRQLIYAS
ncbi:MAG: nucleotidyltransferase domain-containing protein [Thermostichales cyanobacterium BF4_bins_65]